MASTQNSTLITAEYPLVGDNIDQSSIIHRPGVTYTKTTVLVPSDRRLILIPSSIPIPVNSNITAVLFGPLQDTANTRNSANPSVFGASFEKSGEHNAALPTSSVDSHANNANSSDPELLISLIGSSSVQFNSIEAASNLNTEQTKDALSLGWTQLPTLVEESSEVDNRGGVDTNQQTPAVSPNSEDDEYQGSDIGSETRPPSTVNQQPGSTNSPAIGSLKRSLEEPTVELEKPKKPRNSFFYFRREYHKRTNANGGRTKAKNISGLAGKVWKEMTEEEKEPYKQFAAQDTLRYKQETKVYKEAIKREKKKAKLNEKSSEASALLNDDASESSARLFLDATPSSLPAAGISDSTNSFDIASFMSGMPIDVPADIIHTPSIFNEPMIISIDPNALPSASNSTKQVMVSVDFNDQHAASAAAQLTVSASTPMQSHSSPSLAQSRLQLYPNQAYHHGQISFHPISTIPISHQPQPQHQSPLLHLQHQHQHQQLQHQQLRQSEQHQQQYPLQTQTQPQAQHYNQLSVQQRWQDISSLISTINAAPSSEAFANNNFFAALSDTNNQSPIPMMSDHFPIFSGHQTLALTSNAPNPVANRGRSNTTPGSITMLSSIPEVEVIDATNSITLPTYSLSRRS
ncbi:hypothetical protein GGI25_005540 [Coemansia spiralis]|uniref:HMG box domain-containing protein n=2 Tax=Coemansia TaxID=4863 RepID=A0A9W8KW55_9FUNG|nr:hypothetical protein BX070DRAFT_251343 [Coemansia spiralis]KAJ1987909.1 hypothetical protein EDC05_005592 [Coemansia umbellata]KAJ2619472.1 hypothetical protein GGI26_005800 [Coemansia sp. RSA 1358]KAJ2671297.1 hypothetical protein GGI25_005540 [Coemansia spiralis]